MFLNILLLVSFLFQRIIFFRVYFLYQFFPFFISNVYFFLFLSLVVINVDFSMHFILWRFPTFSKIFSFFSSSIQCFPHLSLSLTPVPSSTLRALFIKCLHFLFINAILFYFFTFYKLFHAIFISLIPFCECVCVCVRVHV